MILHAALLQARIGNGAVWAARPSVVPVVHLYWPWSLCCSSPMAVEIYPGCFKSKAQASCAPGTWITECSICFAPALSSASCSSTVVGAAASWLQARSCIPALQHGSGCSRSLTKECVEKPRAVWEKEEKVSVLYCNLHIWYHQNQWRDWINWPQFICLLLQCVKNKYRTHFRITSVVEFGVF